MLLSAVFSNTLARGTMGMAIICMVKSENVTKRANTTSDCGEAEDDVKYEVRIFKNIFKLV